MQAVEVYACIPHPHIHNIFQRIELDLLRILIRRVIHGIVQTKLF